MTARAALLAALLVVAGSTIAVAGVSPAAAQPLVGSDPPEETQDGATFTVSTQSLDLHQSEGGKICAKKLAPDVNKVTIIEATMHGVELYLGNEEDPQKVSAPTAEVDEIVLYTNGENRLVNLLATTGACIPLDQPQQTVLEVYYQEAGTLQMDQFEYAASGAGSPPEPGGFTLPASLLNNSSSEGPVPNATETLNRTTAVVGNASDQVGTATGAVNETVENATGTVDRVNETAGNVTDVADSVESPTGTVDDTMETVDGTTGTVTETVDGTVRNTTGEVNETVEDDTGTLNRTTGTVDNVTDTVDETTSGVNDTTDTVDDTADSVTDPTEGPGDTTGDATTEVRDAVDDTQDTVNDTADTVDDTTGDATKTVEDTTTEVRTTAEEVVPPTAGFGLGENVPLVGDAITLDASKSSDADGKIAKYEWDLDGDGTYDKTGQQVTHAFSDPGEKEVTLRVTDDDGETNTATKTVRVNAPPTAAFSVLSDLLTVGEPISLDASKSSDPDGEIAKYEWDLDGDGEFEQTGATPSPTFDSLGTHEITLRVTDGDGATDTVTKSIDLTESDDGGLLSGGSSDGGSTTTDGGSTTDDGGSSSDGGSLIGAILP